MRYFDSIVKPKASRLASEVRVFLEAPPQKADRRARDDIALQRDTRRAET
jgi:hypothetical protein